MPNDKGGNGLLARIAPFDFHGFGSGNKRDHFPREKCPSIVAADLSYPGIGGARFSSSGPNLGSLSRLSRLGFVSCKSLLLVLRISFLKGLSSWDSCDWCLGWKRDFLASWNWVVGFLSRERKHGRLSRQNCRLCG